MPPADTDTTDLKRTALYSLHAELGAKLVPFAGYEMPVSYPLGILKEHLHTREAAGLFDVSHMGQATLRGEAVASVMESLVPGDIQGLAPGETRYSLLLNEAGGILDDLMITRPRDDSSGDRLFLVVNAACKDADFAHIESQLTGKAKLERLEDRALLALQGPKAAGVLARHCPEVAGLGFMTVAPLAVAGIDCLVSRSGYSGEDGYEISLPASEAEKLARLLLEADEVEAIGLGARDSLRLEAGLCLYGHDIDQTTTPVEASLSWAIGRRRRAEGGFPGAEKILRQLAEGAPRRRVGIRPAGRAPVREGAVLTDPEGREIGAITSGGFGPSVGGPVAMGYVETPYAKAGTAVRAIVRDRPMEAEVAKLPFIETKYHKP